MLEAAVVSFGRVGIAKTTVEEVAAEAGVARASVYRWFPGGRDELVVAAIGYEVGRFFDGLAAEVDDATDPAEYLERTLLYARRTLAQHEVLQKVLETEPERLLPQLSNAGPVVLAMLRERLTAVLAGEQLRPGLAADDAADWLGRMVLSFIVAGGVWRVDDPAAVRELVRHELLAGVLASVPGD